MLFPFPMRIPFIVALPRQVRLIPKSTREFAQEFSLCPFNASARGTGGGGGPLRGPFFTAQHMQVPENPF